jgi:hypothetical protein
VGAFSAAGALVLATAAPSFAQVATSACPGYPVIRLENPAPGEGVPRAGVNISGIAYDPASTSGPGIAAVQVFVGDRDQGGLYRGAATLGQRNPFQPAGNLATAGFVRNANLAIAGGAKLVYVYATSNTGKVSWVAIPIRASGEGPVMSAPTQTCDRPNPVAAAIAAAPAAATQATSGAAASIITGRPFLAVTGPLGGTFPRARIVFSGVAYDPASRSGTGVESIRAFAGPREAGGKYLGAATRNQSNTVDPNPTFRNAGWTLSANLATVGTGARGIYFYALGSNGQESVVVIPAVIV